MQEVTCFHCNTVVQISPDKSLCTECGEDLQHLLAADYVAEHYYHRAQALAASGDPATALAEVERGLTYAGSAELHLLAAILAQRVGRFDQMRRHVAAIAVDDSLRPEAEWLLRAHQAQQQALRSGARPERVGAPPAPAPSFLDELLGRADDSQDRAHTARTQFLWPVLTAAALMGLVIVAYLWLNQDRGGMDGTAAAEPQGDAMPAESRTLNDATGNGTEEGEWLLPTPTPTPNVPEDIVQATASPVAMADSDLRRVVIIPANPFDIRSFLQSKGRDDLAALSLDAKLQGNKLVVQGVVHQDRQRRELIELAKQAPGVEEVNTVNLLLQPLPTYTVQEGDTLWSIVYDIYGNDAARIDQLFELNRDLLPSPEALRPGMELKIPPAS